MVFQKINNLGPVMCSPQMLDFWKQNQISGIKPAIQIETGLNRLGFREEDIIKLTEDDKRIFGLVLSHLACADEKDHFMNHHQIENFTRLKNKYVPDRCRNQQR